jgi:hypothetical protein
MDSTEISPNKLETMLITLSSLSALSVSEALAHLSKIVEQGGDDALAFEQQGRFQEAAAVYEKVAQAFVEAAHKVPEDDRQRVASLGDYWSLKARRTRLTPTPTTEPAPQPPGKSGQRQDHITDRLAQKIQRKDFELIPDEPKPTTRVRPKPIADVMKPSSTQESPGAKVRPSYSGQIELEEEDTTSQFPREKSRFPRRLEKQAGAGERSEE